jgi:hypothetical protein
VAQIEDVITANGGKLLLTRAHLTFTTNMNDVRTGNLTFSPSALSFATGDALFASDTFGGKSLFVCTNAKEPDEVLLRTDSGAPLLCRYRVGEGEVLLFNTREYPAQDAIRAEYERTLLSLVREQTDAERIWMQTGNDVEFAVYDQEDGTRHFYVLAVDWFRDPAALRHATLRLGDTSYDVALPFGVMLKCVTNGQAAAWAECENGEVLSITDRTVTVQGTGKALFRFAKGGAARSLTVDFTTNPIQELLL